MKERGRDNRGGENERKEENGKRGEMRESTQFSNAGHHKEKRRG